MRSGSRAEGSSGGGAGIASIAGSGIRIEGISRAAYVNATGASLSGTTLPAGTASRAGPAAGDVPAVDASVAANASAATRETTGSTAVLSRGPAAGRNNGARTVRVTAL